MALNRADGDNRFKHLPKKFVIDAFVVYIDLFYILLKVLLLNYSTELVELFY